MTTEKLLMGMEEATFIAHELVRLAPDATLLMDESGLIIEANAIAEQLFGYPPSALCGQPMAVVIPERFRNRHLQHVRDYLQTPRHRPMGTGLKLRGLRRDGSEFAAEISLNPLPTPAGLRVLAAIRDVSAYLRVQQALEQATAELERQVEIRNAELLQVNAELRQEVAERTRVETSLRETGALYRQLVENQPDLICRYLPDTTLTFVNAAYARFFGCRQEELIGQRFIEFLPEEAHAGVWGYLAAFTPSAPDGHYEHTTDRADGVTRWHSWHDFALFDQRGEAIGFQCIGIDVTERKQAEKQLRVINRALQLRSTCNQALVKATEEASFLGEVCRLIVEVGGYRLAWVGFAEHDEARNVRPISQAGYGGGYLDAVQITWADEESGHGPTGTAIRTGQPVVARNLLTDPNFAPWREEALERGYASSIALALRREENVLGALNIYAAEPDAFDAEETKLLAELADDLAYGLTALRTRAERTRIEAALRESEERFRQLSEAAYEGIAVSERGRLTDVSNRLAEMLGYAPAEMIGRGIVDFVAPQAREMVLARIQSSTLEPAEHDLQRKDGSVFPVEVRVRAMPYRGGTVRISAIRDITERKRAEEALRASEERLTLALRGANSGAWEWNATTNRAIWSDDNYRLLGLAPGSVEASYDNWLRCVHPDDRADAQRQVVQAMAQGGDLNIDFRVVWPDGSIHWLNDIGTMQYDAAGKPVGMYGVHMDITERKMAEESLSRSEERFKLAMAATQDGLWDWNVKTGEVYYSPGYSMMLGYEPGELEGRLTTWADLVHPDDRDQAARANTDCVENRCPSFEVEFRMRAKNGSWKWILGRGRSVARDETGRATRMIGTHVDITERKQAEETLFEAKERAQVTLHSIGDAVITTDAHGAVDYLNPVAEALTGWNTAAAHGRALNEVFRIVNEDTGQPASDPVAGCLQQGKIVGLSNHSILISRDGQQYHVDDSAAPIRGRDGQVLGVVLVFHDVTETRRLTRQLEHDATHDALTGLINRAEFERRLAHALTSAQRYGTHHALCYLDLDQFKVVNDTAGHAAGDDLLRQIRTVLGGMFRERDTLARIGGDEFGLLLDNCPLDRAQLIAQTVVSKIRDLRFEWAGRTYQIGASLGLVPIAPETLDTAQLLTQADVACYIAKELGRNRVHVYQPEDSETAQHHDEIFGAAGLRDALEQGRFRLHYQPIVALHTPEQAPVRYEALLRVAYKSSPDEDSELVLPSSFIPAAERYGLMDAIDRWVIEAAFGEYAAGPGQIGAQIAVNLSGNSLNDDRLLEFIEAQFTEHGLAPERVCFEITETAAIQNLRRASDLMAALRCRGCQFALDDFGSGLSSFHYLKSLPIDYLKIDGSFVKDMIESENDAALVAAINQMSHTLGIRTIAECAHSGAIVERLRELGVDYAQGYFIGQPAPWNGSQ